MARDERQQRKPFDFKYPYASYMDVSLMRETHTKKELLAEYKRLRREAQVRLNQLERYKWMKDSDVYQYNKDRFKGAVSRMTKAELAKQMRDAAIFVTSKTSTAFGQRERRNNLLDTFRDGWGLTFLNKSNVVEFSRFLGAARANFGAAHYSMDEVEALFRTAKKDKLDMDQIEQNFDAFVEQAQGSKAYANYMRSAEERFSSDDYDR